MTFKAAGAPCDLMREHILLNSSHTHAGPQLASKIAAKDQTGEALRVVEYTRQLQDKVAEAVWSCPEQAISIS